ncbi:hypothetical protein [Caudoviricetes sp.]|nr:hypothetical protein [Caudoviricetes sp.]
MAFFIYLMSVVDGVRLILEVVNVIGLICISIAGIITFAVCSDYGLDNEDSKNLIKYFKKCLKVVVLIALASALTPNSKTLAAMYLIPRIAESKELNDISSKGFELLNLKLDEWIDDVRKEKTK